jgi:hypothetical protein
MPEKYGFFEYYLGMCIIPAVLEMLAAAGNTLRTTILRHWYCDGCDAYHSPRVKRKRHYRELGPFTIIDVESCSLWWEKYDPGERGQNRD